MKSKITIRVTKMDIERGFPLSENRCPVALAASRAFHKPMSAVPSSIWERSASRSIWDKRIKLPESVGDKILRYDQGKGMKPFQFTVEV